MCIYSAFWTTKSPLDGYDGLVTNKTVSTIQNSRMVLAGAEKLSKRLSGSISCGVNICIAGAGPLSQEHICKPLGRKPPHIRGIGCGAVLEWI